MVEYSLHLKAYSRTKEMKRMEELPHEQQGKD